MKQESIVLRYFLIFRFIRGYNIEFDYSEISDGGEAGVSIQNQIGSPNSDTSDYTEYNRLLSRYQVRPQGAACTCESAPLAVFCVL